MPALLQADEYCVEIECLDLRTGLPIGARRCEPGTATGTWLGLLAHGGLRRRRPAPAR